MSVGNKIIYNFPRPAKELVEQFRGMPVANIDDNMGRIAAVDSAIVPINSSPLVGTAFTIRETAAYRSRTLPNGRISPKNTSSRSFRRSAAPASCSRTAAIRAATGWPAGRRTTPRGTFCA